MGNYKYSTAALLGRLNGIKRIFSLAIILTLACNTSFAQSINKSFKVNGDCNKCKKTIEKAANSIPGVEKASWNKKTKKMDIDFDITKTNIHQIHLRIAASGYDTDLRQAPDKAYNNLPACCQYDREDFTALWNVNDNEGFEERKACCGR